MSAAFWWEDLKERHNLADLVLYGRTILKWMLNKSYWFLSGQKDVSQTFENHCNKYITGEELFEGV